MGKSMKSRAVIGIAAVALLLSVLVGVAANVSFGSELTTSSITWCRSCI
jgi:hypothetical protein